MKLWLPAGVTSPLGRRLAWLTLLRLLALAAFLGIVEFYYNRDLPSGGFSSTVAVTTVTIAFVLTVGYALVLRRERGLRTIAYVQHSTDQLVWTALAYVSWGITSGSTSLYGLTCLSAAILLGTRGAVLAAVVGMTSYGLMCIAFATGTLPPPMDQPVEAYVIDPQAMVYPAFSTLMATALVTALAAYLAARLQTFGGRLEEATKRAEDAERLAALGRLSAALAHEVRNPLGSIRGSIELLRTGGTLGDEDTRLCTIIERETARLDDLVTDMVHLSRPREPDRREIDLAATARSVVELAERSGRAEHISLRYEGPKAATITADAAQMRQVLWNLVRNAIQASSAGDDICVGLTEEDDGDLVMQVSDQGSGIPESSRAHIFDAFFTTRSHGMGIGLAVVKQVSDAHAFELTVESEPDQGTTFAMRVPKPHVLGLSALVLAGALLLVGGLGCGGGSDWLEAGAGRSGPGSGDDMWWGDDDASSPAGSEPASAGSAAATAPGPGTANPKLALTGDPSSGTPLEEYRNTYYDFPQERARSSQAATRQLFDSSCQPIRTVSRVFHDQLCVQGSGRLATGQTVSFAKRDCACAAECPRTAQRICFDLLDPKEFPYGRGASGKAITPLRTVAVDSDLVPLGTVLYIPAYHGLRGPDGADHDGCFIAQDRGLKVKGKHVDVFTGDPRTTVSWNAAVPSNQGVKVILGADRCAYLRSVSPGK
ncbi:MAG: hypothetical protein JRI68_01440 [Deltaproteobacteria bacterium]|nr:hypothetical protein [Deltaproteobacteria bacterium]